MDSYREDFSKLLRQTRIACGLSQREVAEALHMTRSTYTYFETAKMMPDVATLKKIAEVFSVPMENFCYPENYIE